MLAARESGPERHQAQYPVSWHLASLLGPQESGRLAARRPAVGPHQRPERERYLRRVHRLLTSVIVEQLVRATRRVMVGADTETAQRKRHTVRELDRKRREPGFRNTVLAWAVVGPEPTDEPSVDRESELRSLVQFPVDAPIAALGPVDNRQAGESQRRA